MSQQYVAAVSQEHVASGAPHQPAAPNHPAGSGQGGAGQGTANNGGSLSSDASRISTEKASELLKQLRSTTSAWFSAVRNGLHEPYAFEKAQADQERIGEIFAALQQELSKTGLDNLLIDDKLKNTQGEEVKLAKLPRQVLAKEPDATSSKMIEELKEISSKLGSELEEMHKVAENATRQLTNPPVAGGETHVVKK